MQIISWDFIATGIIFRSSSTFQRLGNTWPSLLSSTSRLVTFAVPALWLSRQPGFKPEQLWYLLVATMTVQMLTSLWLLRGKFRARVAPLGTGLPTPPSARPS